MPRPEQPLPLQLSRTQRRKLHRLLLDAWRGVPMYRSIYSRAGLTEHDLADPLILTRLPVLTKQQLVATPLEQRVDRRFDIAGLARETTTGSTGQPFSICIDRRYRFLRNQRFLRGLLAAGYRPWHRMLLLTDRHAGLSRRHHWYYQSVEVPTADILGAYAAVRPHLLYGFATPLRLLAEALLQRPRRLPTPRLVVSTAELLDAATRRTLESAFGCPVVDFYGMTEMGLVAWQTPGSDGYRMSRSAVLTELLPDNSCHGRYRMVMTNLDLRACPVIRFDSGDLALVGNSGGQARVTGFEGRVVDTILCRDGTELSPYRITDALRDVPGVKRFKVTQTDLSALAIDLEVEPDSRNQAVERIRAVLDELLGAGLELTFGFTDKLVPQGARKFRPVESQVARP